MAVVAVLARAATLRRLRAWAGHRGRAVIGAAAVAGLLLAVPMAASAAPQGSPAVEEHTTTVRYGPLLLPPSFGLGDEHGQKMTFAGPTYDLPCRDCFITGVQPDMVYADGSQANHHTGVMLHHMVVFNPSEEDVTCRREGVGLATGQRIFAAGNERTGARLPPGYGYRLGDKPLGAVAELMNMSARPQQVYVTLDVTWVDAHDGALREVTPVWLDVDNCGDSQYTVPQGPSHTRWEWDATIAGDVVAAGGHVHDHGVAITLSNLTRSERICESVAGYGTDPRYMGHIESMSTCTGDPVATVGAGDTLELGSYYDAPEPDDTAMGIMIAYVHER